MTQGVLPSITIEHFRAAAREFAELLRTTPLHALYGVTDGKAIGTTVEMLFKKYLQERYDVVVGNSASGLDFPSLNLDLKVTSNRQPQSSCPFKSATQKIYGLGYHLLVIVYEKSDIPSERVAYLEIKNVLFIDQSCTSDYSLTKMIRLLVETARLEGTSEEALVDDLDALLQDKNLPLDEVSRRQLAQRLVIQPPEQGVLTISNALQWRLQYNRAIDTAVAKSNVPHVEDLCGKE